MNSSDKEKTLFRILLNRSLDGEASVEDIQRMNALLSTYPDLQAYYLKLMKIQTAIYEIQIEDVYPQSANTSSDDQFWANMAEYEKTAPEIVLSQEEPQKELIQKIVYPSREKQRVSKLTIFTLVNVAAVILFLIVLHFAPSEDGIGVATLTDSLNAKWADLTIPQGTRLKSDGSTLILREGIAKILFDNNTKCVLEAPVEFELLSREQVSLRYGSLYAIVPKEGIGFSVDTSNSRIIDLGTEFGVNADVHGNTFLHVTKGKTVLIAGDKTNKKTVDVTGGDAKKVSAQSQAISNISCNDRLFIRDINSESNLIWRGETELSLADIVGGGNGFGEIHSLVGLNPATGQYTASVIREGRTAEKSYALVPDSTFIDGVFVADGNEVAAIPISSMGHTFACPDTEGFFTHEIAVYRGDIEKQQGTIPPAIFNGHKYEDAAIVMIHSNAGITFDLAAIRQSLPGLDLTGFHAFGGLTEAFNSLETEFPDIDFWVLVDGEIRYDKKMLTLEDGTVSFDIVLSPHDCFLTLIVADGYRSTEPDKGYPALSNDFFYLIDPVLKIQEPLQ